MKLITKEIEEALKKYPCIHKTEKVVMPFARQNSSFPCGAWTWYITEANLDTGELFGVTINSTGEGEYGYISLSELQNLKVMGLGVERDKTFKPKPLKEINDPYLKNFLN